MRKLKKVYKEYEEINEVFCNMCEKPIKKDEFGKFYDYISIDKHWGYLSSFDGERHQFDLCNECYKSIIKNFKITVSEN